MAIRNKRDTSASIKARQARTVDISHSGFYPYLLQFLEHETIHGCSEDTTRRRKQALRKFIAWCDDRDLQRPHDITRPILERYKRHLFYYRKPDGDPLSIGSQQVLLTPIKTFFKWLTRENHILYNPASEMEVPKKPKRLPLTILQIDEIEHLLNSIDTGKPQGIRDRTIIEMLYSTGMRRLELTQLMLYDIDAKRGTVFIHEGKGQKDRVIPIGDRALQWLDLYQQHSRPELAIEPDKGILILTDYGEPFKRDALSALVKRLLKNAGIQVKGSCHLFRHACATHMLNNGADIRFIQHILGHEDLTTTEVYTQVSIEKLKQIHAATHPATQK